MVYISFVFFLLSNRYKLLLTNFLIKLTVFDKTIRTSFFSFFKADASINSLRSFATKPFLMNITLTIWLWLFNYHQMAVLLLEFPDNVSHLGGIVLSIS